MDGVETLVCLAVLFINLSMTSGVTCGDDTVWITGGVTSGWLSCYHISQDQLSWQDAKNQCQTLDGGDLIILGDSAEHYDVTTSLSDNAHYYIGLYLEDTDVANSGTTREKRGAFRWYDGTAVSDSLSSTWLSTQPRDGDQCAKYYFYQGDDPKRWVWFGESCGIPRNYICEKKVQMEETTTESVTTSDVAGTTSSTEAQLTTQSPALTSQSRDATTMTTSQDAVITSSTSRHSTASNSTLTSTSTSTLTTTVTSTSSATAKITSTSKVTTTPVITWGSTAAIHSVTTENSTLPAEPPETPAPASGDEDDFPVLLVACVLVGLVIIIIILLVIIVMFFKRHHRQRKTAASQDDLAGEDQYFNYGGPSEATIKEEHEYEELPSAATVSSERRSGVMVQN